METVESTDALMALLENGRYKRLVMENDGEALDTKEAVDAMFADIQTRMSRPDNYDYFTRRQIGEIRELKGGDGE